MLLTECRDKEMKQFQKMQLLSSPRGLETPLKNFTVNIILQKLLSNHIKGLTFDQSVNYEITSCKTLCKLQF